MFDEAASAPNSHFTYDLMTMVAQPWYTICAIRNSRDVMATDPGGYCALGGGGGGTPGSTMSLELQPSGKIINRGAGFYRGMNW